MALTFANYERAESTLTDEGTVISKIPGGKLKFCPGTIDRYNAKSIKAMSILLFNKKGESTSVPMSKTLSATVAKALDAGTDKKTILGAISKLSIYENEEGMNIIGRPQGSSEEEIEFTAVELAKVTADYEALVAF